LTQRNSKEETDLGPPLDLKEQNQLSIDDRKHAFKNSRTAQSSAMEINENLQGHSSHGKEGSESG